MGAELTPVLSFGGGVNSVALAILLAKRGWQGTLVFADTGAEWPETYEYLDSFLPWLARRGLKFVVVGAEYRSNRYKVSLPEAIEKYKMIPLARARWCTTEYKIRPIQRWCRSTGVDFSQMMLGIAADESHRQPDKIRPLVDWGITRDDCARVIVEAGLPVPPKSGCWCCPFQRRSQWRFLYERYPELFQRAMALEKTVGCTFSPDGESLEEIISQPALFDFSEFYMPCLCRI